MFSGIIEEAVEVQSVIEGDEGRRISVLSHQDHGDTQIGDSICIDGVCLTVVACERAETNPEGWLLSFDIASETLRCTTCCDVGIGGHVHLERSLCVGGRIHGHIVTGHVDGVGEVSSRTEEGETTKLQIYLPEPSPLVAPKGSITLAGVSLTVGQVEGGEFSVYLIPHTKAVTHLGELQKGARINIEFDMLARYVCQQLNFTTRVS